jgi:hypothetical protein
MAGTKMAVTMESCHHIIIVLVVVIATRLIFFVGILAAASAFAVSTVFTGTIVCT